MKRMSVAGPAARGGVFREWRRGERDRMSVRSPFLYTHPSSVLHRVLVTLWKMLLEDAVQTSPSYARVVDVSAETLVGRGRGGLDAGGERRRPSRGGRKWVSVLACQSTNNPRIPSRGSQPGTLVVAASFLLHPFGWPSLPPFLSPSFPLPSL